MTTNSLTQSPLSLDESAELVRLEIVVEFGLKTFVEVGKALATIRDRQLYRIELETFAAYCRDKWNMSDRRARQLMDASEVVAEISKSGTIVPKSESVIRPLTKLPPEQRAEAYNEAVNISPRGKPAARVVATVVARILPQKAAKPARATPPPAAPDAQEHQEMQDALATFAMDNERLTRENEALAATDQGKQIAKMNKELEALRGRINGQLAEAKVMEKDLKYWRGICDKVVRILGVEKPSQVYAAVEKLKAAAEEPEPLEGKSWLQTAMAAYRQLSPENRGLFDNSTDGLKGKS